MAEKVCVGCLPVSSRDVQRTPVVGDLRGIISFLFALAEKGETNNNAGTLARA